MIVKIESFCVLISQVIHMVSAAKGAEPFYTCEGHKTRTEDYEGARNLDTITADVGHVKNIASRGSMT